MSGKPARTSFRVIKPRFDWGVPWGMVLLVSLAAAADDRFPAELVEFSPAAGGPVFTGREGAWDSAIRERGWIEHDESGWHLWYTGYDGTREGIRRLGYATSDDGIHWERNQEDPLIENLWVEDMTVIHHGSAWYMFAEGWQDQAQLLISVDRIHWQRIGALDIRMVDGTPISPGPFGTPTVWVEDGIWYLFYERRDQGVWLAASEDLRTWTNIQDESVLSLGPDDNDRVMIAMNQIVKANGSYYAYYHGSGSPASPRLWCPSVAVSDDLVHWTKYSGNPLRPAEENKSSCLLIQDGDRWLLYTMHGEVMVHQAVE